MKAIAIGLFLVASLNAIILFVTRRWRPKDPNVAFLVRGYRVVMWIGILGTLLALLRIALLKTE